MIKSFRHRGIERFFRSGSQAGIQPKHASKLAPTFHMNEINRRFVDATFAVTCSGPNLGLGCRR